MPTKHLQRFICIILLITSACIPVTGLTVTSTPAKATRTPTGAAATATASRTSTISPTATAHGTHTQAATETPGITQTPDTEPDLVTPFPDAPQCEAHDPTQPHTLWNPTLGCHYDHEHGADPTTPEVAAAFPDFDLLALLGGDWICHTNPSSEMECTHKHGGFKWQVDLNAPKGCTVGFESGTVAVDAYAVKVHAFGRQDHEFETSTHSTAGVLRQCKQGDPNDKGYIYFAQLQNYGLRAMPYQGMALIYPDNFSPLYDPAFGPYLTTECEGTDFSISQIFYVFDTPNTVTNFVDCRNTGDTTSNNASTWTSKNTGRGYRPPGSTLFNLLFRGRDNYQRIKANDLTWPFTWTFVCGDVDFIQTGCPFNNTTLRIHEISGTIPTSWDNTPFDLDPRVGRVTFTGFVDPYGTLKTDCESAGGLCHPIKLVSAFTGKYSSDLCAVKCTNPDPGNTPERDFCWNPAGVLVGCDTPGAIPSGWPGSEN